MKKRITLLFALCASLFFTACKATGDMVKVGEIDGLVRNVCDRHDSLVNGTLKFSEMSEQKRASYLRSTAILRKVLDAALEAK